MNYITLFLILVSVFASSCKNKNGEEPGDNNGNITKNNLLFYDDCEDEWDTHYWHESHVNVSCQGKTNILEVSGEQAREGNHSYKFTLAHWSRNCDWISNCELNFYWAADANPSEGNNFQFNETYWLGYSVFIPLNFEQPDGPTTEHDGNEWLLDSQFHGAPGSDDLNSHCDAGTNPNVAFFYRSGPGYTGYGFSLRGDSAKCIRQPPSYSISYDRNQGYSENTPPSESVPLPEKLNVARGEWHDIVVNFKFSYKQEDEPFFKLWIDSMLVVSDTGINCYNDVKGPYWIMGPYGHMNKDVTFFYDEIRLGNSESSYDEVKPGASNKM